MDAPMLRVMHVITSLEVGGSERMLTRLVGVMDSARFNSCVVPLTDGGTLASAVRAAGVEVFTLGMARGRVTPGGLLKLLRLMRAWRPDLIQSWLYHADLLALVARSLAWQVPLVWNLRCSDMELGRYSPLSAMVRWLLARLSPRPEAVVVNSVAGQRVHTQLGYCPRRWVLIPNGIDPARFHPDPGASTWLRTHLDIPSKACLVGMVARVDPMKDHATALQAMAVGGEAIRPLHLVLIGSGTEKLRSDVERLSLVGRVHLLGLRDDMERLLPGLDIFCLSSAFGEGFPNALAEAMACGLVCVTTDVGDAKRILGSTGHVVPPKQPEALAGAWRHLMTLSVETRQRMGLEARERVEQHYSLGAVAREYEALYEELTQVHVRDPQPH